MCVLMHVCVCLCARAFNQTIAFFTFIPYITTACYINIQYNVVSSITMHNYKFIIKSHYHQNQLHLCKYSSSCFLKLIILYYSKYNDIIL